MSNNMLEQAIVDAKELREAAVKNAETQIIEKYSSEVKDAVAKLLEEDEGLDDPMMGLDDEPEVTSTAMEQVPMAHLSDSSDEDEIVVVNLDDIIDAAETEDQEEIEDGGLERDEIADEIGLDIEDETLDVPANRTDDEEIEIDEGDLVNIFKEIMAVDVPQIELDRAAESDEEEVLEQDEELEMTRTDGMNKEDIEDYKRHELQNESLKKENNLLKNLLEKVKDRLEETNLQNARLLYANRVLSDTSLNEQQKNKIVGIIDNACSVEEAKTVFETLQKTMVARPENSPESLSEVVSRPSSVIISGNRKGDDSNKNKGSHTYNRWATLAGTKK